MIGSKYEVRHSHYHFLRYHTGQSPQPIKLSKPWLTIIGEFIGLLVFLGVLAVFV